MALKKAMVLKLAVVALLLAAVSAKSGVDFYELLSSNNPDAVKLAARDPPCCDNCSCTRSIPPKCSCKDIFVGLDRCDNCEACICTRSFPPQCRCADITNFCYPKCKAKADDHHEAVPAVEMIKQITSFSD